MNQYVQVMLAQAGLIPELYYFGCCGREPQSTVVETWSSAEQAAGPPRHTLLMAITAAEGSYH